MFSSYDPNTLDWSGVDVVLECTGNFNDGEKAKIPSTTVKKPRSTWREVPKRS